MSRWLIACGYPTGTSGKPVIEENNNSEDTVSKNPKEKGQVIQVNPGYSKEDIEIKVDSGSTTDPIINAETSI